MKDDVVLAIARKLRLPVDVVAGVVTSPESLRGCLAYPEVERILDEVKPARQSSHTATLIQSRDKSP